ncbi:MAG: fibronectin type III domain-containing protein, partial [Woeseiaceae bacterium]
MAILNIIQLRQAALLIAVILTLSACGGSDDGGGVSGISIKAKALSATSIRVKWSKPDGAVKFSPYRVAMEDQYSSQVIVSTTSLTYTVTNLRPETRYCFFIKMPLTGLVASNRSCATTDADTEAPSTPSELTAEATSPVTVALSWNRSSDNFLVSGYDVYRNGDLLYTNSSSGATDRDVVPGTTNCYAVSAHDPWENESPRSTEVCVDVPMDVSPPTTPTNVAATFDRSGSQPTIAVSWNQSSDDGRLSFYQVFREGILVGDETGLLYTDVALDTDAKYCYTIVAVDSVGNASNSSKPACAREGWTAITMDSSLTYATAVTVDNMGRAHIAFKEYTYDSSRNEIRHPLTYALIENGQATRQDVLENGTEPFFFSDAYRLAMVADLNNVVHIVHKRNDPPQPEAVRHLQVDGNTVSSSPLEQTNSPMTAISLAIDSIGAIHACYGLSSRLTYATNATGVWVITDAATLVPGASGYDCDIAVDNADNVHISFLEYQTHDLMYLGNAAGDWTLDRIDIHSSSNVSTTHNTSIDVDAAGNPHIAYFHDYADNDLEYATKSSGNWTS